MFTHGKTRQNTLTLFVVASEASLAPAPNRTHQVVPKIMDEFTSFLCIVAIILFILFGTPAFFLIFPKARPAWYISLENRYSRAAWSQ